MGVTILLLLTFVLVFTKIGKKITRNESDESSFERFFPQEEFDEVKSDFVNVVKEEPVQTTMSERRSESKEQKVVIDNSKDKKKEFSLRDAVIYSTILERPYK